MPKSMTLKTALGPLWPIYNNPDVNEILVDSEDDVYYVEKGVIKDAQKLFKNSSDILKVINNLTTFLGKKREKDEYCYRMQMDKFNRIAVTLPPVAMKGPALNILRLPAKSISFEDLHKYGAIDDKSGPIIEKLINEGKSLLVGGNMGSGKTTLLNCLVEKIPYPNRVVTIEKTPDLLIERKKCLRLIAPHHKDEEVIELIHNAKLLRADWVILSWMNGQEMNEFVNLVNEGHKAMVCVTALNVFDVMRRLEIKLLSTNPGMRLDDVRYTIAQAFQAIVFQERLPNGKRKVNCIAEITYESGENKLNILYKG